MKKELKYILKMTDTEVLTPMFEIIYKKAKTPKILKKCFDLIDNYELQIIFFYIFLN